MKTTTVNDDVELCYRDEGSGHPLVFLHAFPLDQTMWDDQVTYFSDAYRVITLDWRGFGGSSLGTLPSNMPVFADDLAGLLDALEIGKATICGLSMGGYGALGFLRKYRERVSTLLLVDTRATSDTEDARQNRVKMAALAREKGSAAIADQMIPKLLGATTMNNRPDVVERVRAMILANEGEGIARALMGMAERADSTSLLGEIRCPTLVVVGEEDTLTPPKDSEVMAWTIVGSRLAILTGVGHLSNLEDPEQFNQVVKSFLVSG